MRRTSHWIRRSLGLWVKHLRDLTNEDAGDHIAAHVTADALLRLHEGKIMLHVGKFDDQVIADMLAYAVAKTFMGNRGDTERLKRWWDAASRGG